MELSAPLLEPFGTLQHSTCACCSALDPWSLPRAKPLGRPVLLNLGWKSSQLLKPSPEPQARLSQSEDIHSGIWVQTPRQ